MSRGEGARRTRRVVAAARGCVGGPVGAAPSRRARARCAARRAAGYAFVVRAVRAVRLRDPRRTPPACLPATPHASTRHASRDLRSEREPTRGTLAPALTPRDARRTPADPWRARTRRSPEHRLDAHAPHERPQTRTRTHPKTRRARRHAIPNARSNRCTLAPGARDRPRFQRPPRQRARGAQWRGGGGARDPRPRGAVRCATTRRAHAQSPCARLARARTRSPPRRHPRRDLPRLTARHATSTGLPPRRACHARGSGGSWCCVLRMVCSATAHCCVLRIPHRRVEQLNAGGTDLRLRRQHAVDGTLKRVLRLDDRLESDGGR